MLDFQQTPSPTLSSPGSLPENIPPPMWPAHHHARLIFLNPRFYFTPSSSMNVLMPLGSRSNLLQRLPSNDPFFLYSYTASFTGTPEDALHFPPYLLTHLPHPQPGRTELLAVDWKRALTRASGSATRQSVNFRKPPHSLGLSSVIKLDWIILKAFFPSSKFNDSPINLAFKQTSASQVILRPK